LLYSGKNYHIESIKLETRFLVLCSTKQKENNMADVIHVTIDFLYGRREDFYTHQSFAVLGDLVYWLTKGVTVAYPISTIRVITEE